MKFRMFLVIFALTIFFRICAVYTMPVFSDEKAHLNYIKIINTLGSIPPNAYGQGTSAKNNLPLLYENYQPPGYYVPAAVLGITTIKGARLYSIVLFLIAFIFLYRAGVDRNLLLVIAFLPGIVYTFSSVTNDVFLFLSSSVLYCGWQRKKFAWFVGGAFLLSVSKFHAIPIFAVLSVYLILKEFYYRIGAKRRDYLLVSVCGLVVATLIFAWRYELSTVNSLGFVLPDMVALTSIFSQSIITGVFHPDFAMIPLDIKILSIPIGFFFVYKAFLRTPNLPILNNWIIFSIVAIWLVFSFTHVHWVGRLVYPALPWLALERGSK